MLQNDVRNESLSCYADAVSVRVCVFIMRKCPVAFEIEQ